METRPAGVVLEDGRKSAVERDPPGRWLWLLAFGCLTLGTLDWVLINFVWGPPLLAPDNGEQALQHTPEVVVATEGESAPRIPSQAEQALVGSSEPTLPAGPAPEVLPAAGSAELAPAVQPEDAPAEPSPVPVAAPPEPATRPSGPLVATGTDPPQEAAPPSPWRGVVHFDSRSAALNQEARQVLEEAFLLMQDRPKAQLRIEGHADRRGDDSFNLSLSRRRARAVLAYFVERGLSERRFVINACSEDQPLDRHWTFRAHAVNRRVELILR